MYGVCAAPAHPEDASGENETGDHHEDEAVFGQDGFLADVELLVCPRIQDEAVERADREGANEDGDVREVGISAWEVVAREDDGHGLEAHIENAVDEAVVDSDEAEDDFLEEDDEGAEEDFEDGDFDSLELARALDGPIAGVVPEFVGLFIKDGFRVCLWGNEKENGKGQTGHDAGDVLGPPPAEVRLGDVAADNGGD